MSIAEAIATVPTRKKQDRVAEKVSDAAGAVEGLARQLREVDEDATVTAADIGVLWSLSDGVRLDLESLRDDLGAIQRELGRLDNIRLDAERKQP